MAGLGINPQMPPAGGAPPPHQPVEVQQLILGAIQQQPRFTQGWQTMVPDQERVGKIMRLFTSLRLVAKEVPHRELLRLALGNEYSDFQRSVDKAHYEALCINRMAEQRDQRQALNTAAHQQQQQQQQQQQAYQAQVHAHAQAQQAHAHQVQAHAHAQAQAQAQHAQQVQARAQAHAQAQAQAHANAQAQAHAQAQGQMQHAPEQPGLSMAPSPANVMPGQMPGHHNFPPQLQRPMQVSPLPTSQSSQPPPQPVRATAVDGLPTAAMAPGQQRPPFPTPTAAPNGGLPPGARVPLPFNAQENAEIAAAARRMFDSATPNDLARMRAQLSNIPEAQRRQLEQQKVDPLRWAFHQAAVRQFRMARERNLAGRPGVVVPTRPHPSTMPVTTPAATAGGGGGPGALDAFRGTVESVAGLQAHAQSAAKAGQLVVPAHTGQRPSPHEAMMAFTGAPHPAGAITTNTTATPDPRANMPRTMPNPDPSAQQHQMRTNAVQAQQEKLHQAQQMRAETQARAQAQVVAQMQADAQARAFHAMAARQAPPAGELGGHPGPNRPPQQQQPSPAMPMRGPQPTRPPPGAPPPTSTPNTPQPNGPRVGGTPGTAAAAGATPRPPARRLDQVTQPGVARPMVPANMSDAIQQKLNSMTAEEIQQFLTGNVGPVTTVAAPPPPPPSESAAMGRPDGVAATSMVPATSSMQGTPPGSQPERRPQAPGGPQYIGTPPRSEPVGARPRAMPTQPAPVARPPSRQPGQPPQAPQAPPQASPAPARPLAYQPFGAAEMERVPFPTGIPQHLFPGLPIPDGMQAWGDLKRWVLQNQHQLPPGSLEQVNQFQSRHHVQIEQMRAQQFRWQQQQQQQQQQGHVPSGPPQQSQQPPPPSAAAPPPPPPPQQQQQPPPQHPHSPYPPQPAGHPSLAAPGPSQAPMNRTDAPAPTAHQELMARVTAQLRAMPPPTAEEVGRWRARLAEQGRVMADDQITNLIWRARGQELQARAVAQHNQAAGMPLGVAQTPATMMQPGSQPAPQQQPPSYKVPHTMPPQQMPPQPQPVSMPAGPPTHTPQPPASHPTPRPAGQAAAAPPTPAASRPAAAAKGGQAGPKAGRPGSSAKPPTGGTTSKGVKRTSGGEEAGSAASPAQSTIQAPKMQPTRSKQRADPAKGATTAAATANPTVSTTSAPPAPEPPIRPTSAVASRTGVANVAQQQPGQMVPGQVFTPEQMELQQRNRQVQMLIRDVSTTEANRSEVAVDGQVREQMERRLQQGRVYVKQVEQTLMKFLCMTGDENATREVVRIRHLLMHQFIAPSYSEFRDAFTITPNELEYFIERLQRYLEFMKTTSMEKSQRAAAAAIAASQNGSQQGPTATVNAGSPPQMPPNANTPVIVAAAAAARPDTGKSATATAMTRPGSERRQQQQQVPAAPVTTQPPFLLGVSPPDGVPRRYGEPGLTPDQLKQPPAAKRRKLNPATAGAGAAAVGSPAEGKASASPAEGKASASPMMGKGADPKAKHAAAVKPESVVDLPYKCPVADCAFHRTGFASVEALGAHQHEAHEVLEEMVEDPEKYFLDNLAATLGLDEGSSSQAGSMSDAAGASKAVTTGGIKMTATPSRTGQTPGAKAETNMSRGATSIKTAASSQSMVGVGMGAPLPEKSSEMQRDESIQPFKGLLTPPSGWDLGDISLECFKTTLERSLSGEQMLTPRDTPSSSGRTIPKKSDEGSENERGGGESGDITLATIGDVSNDSVSFDMDSFGFGDGLGGGYEMDGFESMMDWESPLDHHDDSNGIGSDWLGTFGSTGEFDGNMFTLRV
ncbi:MAG: hypothetical protein M1823_004131 [Watsoniomyces obsoletus]|nr:MAG: hypothetical protein M1823_004131 [Watsoniomyces obsoletus]